MIELLKDIIIGMIIVIVIYALKEIVFDLFNISIESFELTVILLGIIMGLSIYLIK